MRKNKTENRKFKKSLRRRDHLGCRIRHQEIQKIDDNVLKCGDVRVDTRATKQRLTKGSWQGRERTGENYRESSVPSMSPVASASRASGSNVSRPSDWNLACRLARDLIAPRASIVFFIWKRKRGYSRNGTNCRSAGAHSKNQIKMKKLFRSKDELFLSPTECEGKVFPRTLFNSEP